jgi:hypothetical protein
MFGFVFEQNTGFGINLLGVGPSGYVSFCRFVGIWDEINTLGSAHFSANSFDNMVDYVRYSSNPPLHDVAFDHNLVSGSNVTGAGPGADHVLYHTFYRILTSRFDSTADDKISIRNHDDTYDGMVQLGTLKATSDVRVTDRITLFPTTENPGGELLLWNVDRLETGVPAANIEAQSSRQLQFNSAQTIRLATSQTERLHIDTSGDVAIPARGHGLILKAPSGGCWRLTVNDSGALTTTAAACPL